MSTTTNSATDRKLAMRERQSWIASLSYSQQQRYRFLESRLLWEGEVNRRDICDQFGVTPNHLTREMRSYKTHFPNNLRYDEVNRSYRPGDQFTPVFASGDGQEYLTLLLAHAQSPSDGLKAELGSFAPCDVLLPPQSLIDNAILRGVLLAIHQKRGCEIRYQSFSTPQAENRTIWPHALAWTGDRWHVRAFDGHRNMHIDLALTRIQTIKPSNKACPDAGAIDHAWETFETVEIMPSPDLSAGQQRVVAQEYGMIKRSYGWIWEVSLRRCMIPYFLFRFRLDDCRGSEKSKGFPVQRIVLRDPRVREQHAFRRD